jgi:hypothetical protein
MIIKEITFNNEDVVPAPDFPVTIRGNFTTLLEEILQWVKNHPEVKFPEGLLFYDDDDGLTLKLYYYDADEFCERSKCTHRWESVGGSKELFQCHHCNSYKDSAGTIFHLLSSQ